MRAPEFSNGGPEFLKGHGTENDFVLLPDVQGRLELTPERVRRLCDRRRGLGADGVLRVVPARFVLDAPSDVPASTWFMDYHNADGSLAEMCGNGVRVFAAYLLHAGLVSPGEVVVGTRAGTRTVRVHEDGQVTVDMGPARTLGRSFALVGADRLPGLALDLGNPHLACVTSAGLDDLKLDDTPDYDPELFPNGVNVEFVQPVDTDEVRMRVHERGVGETRSCGTGTVAATVAVLSAEGAGTGAKTVHVPGGTVRVEVTTTTTTLTGPAELVAHGYLAPDWWESSLGADRVVSASVW